MQTNTQSPSPECRAHSLIPSDVLAKAKTELSLFGMPAKVSRATGINRDHLTEIRDAKRISMQENKVKKLAEYFGIDL